MPPAMTADEDVTLGEVHRTVVRIEQKVDKTNGRVTKLESWKDKAIGAWFVVSLAGPVITGLILKGL